MNEQDLILIEKYLDTSLNKDEKDLFDEKINKAPHFKEEVMFQQSIITSLKVQEKVNLKDDLRQMLKEVKNSQKLKKENVMTTYTKKMLKIAAVFALMIIATIGYLYLKPTQQEKLFHAYYEPFPEDPMTRGDKIDTYDEAMKLYGKGEYKEAIPLFQQITTENSDNLRYYLFLGNCYLNTNNIELALNSFTKVLETEDTLVKTHADWYIALCHLKANDKEKALKQLNKIKTGQGLYQKDAEALLQKLE